MAIRGPETVDEYVEQNRDHKARTHYERLLADVLDVVKSMRSVWSKMPEQDQEGLIAQFDDAARSVIRHLVDAIAAADQPHIKVQLDKVVFGDGITGTISMGNTDGMRHRLADAARRSVILVVPDYEQHLQGERPKAREQLQLTLEEDDALTRARRDERGCWVDLLNIGLDWITEEDVAGWSVEMINQARAYARALRDLGEADAPPLMPSFLAQPPLEEKQQ